MADPNTPQGTTGADAPKIRVEVRARNEPGFRRLGRHFTQNPEEIEVTEAEYEQQLRNEGQLIVRRMDGKDRDQSAGATGTRTDTSTAFSAPVGGGHTPGTSTRAEGKPLPDEERDQAAAKRR